MEVPAVKDVVVGREDGGEAAVGVVVEVNKEYPRGDLLFVTDEGFGGPVEAAVGRRFLGVAMVVIR